MHGPLSTDYGSSPQDPLPSTGAAGGEDRAPLETAQVVVLGSDAGMKDKVLSMLHGVDADVRSHETLADCLALLQASPDNRSGFTGSPERSYGGLRNVALVVAVGPLSGFAETCPLDEAKVAFPGASLVAATAETSPSELLGLIRKGFADVLLLGEPEAVAAKVLSDALAKGRASSREAAEMLTLAQRLSTLTAAEHQVLDAMLDGMANKQIAQALEIGLRTVELRRSKIMRKMGAKSLAQLIKFVCTAMRAEQPS